jgi:hypothetical protein
VSEELRVCNETRRQRYAIIYVYSTYGAVDLRVLRLSLNALFESLELALQTVEGFSIT